MSLHPANKQPLLQLGAIDHYTLIVPDAKKTSDFHRDILGFELVEIRELNCDDPSLAMINYIMRLPSSEEQYCVITEGLSEDSIFHQLMKKYGEGIHHIAYTSNDIQTAFSTLAENNILTTSGQVHIDPIRQLKQFFIDRQYFGYFVEVVERKHADDGTTFTDDNMTKLAGTMKAFTLEAESLPQD